MSFPVKLLVGVSSLGALITCMVAPVIIYGLVNDLGSEDPLPDWVGWLVVVGGALGAGVAYLVSRFVLVRYGRITAAEADALWRRR